MIHYRIHRGHRMEYNIEYIAIYNTLQCSKVIHWSPVCTRKAQGATSGFIEFTFFLFFFCLTRIKKCYSFKIQSPPTPPPNKPLMIFCVTRQSENMISISWYNQLITWHVKTQGVWPYHGFRFKKMHHFMWSIKHQT